MLSTIATKFMSTTQSNGSGISIQNEQETLLSNPIGNKRLKVNACGKLYEELCASKPSLYAGAPKTRGIDFQLSYYDSLEALDPKCRHGAPVVCLLHGAPGHYKDFVHLINHLTSKGFRVIAPNFPDYSVTFEHSFRHSPRERLDYLEKFFHALKLDRIEMLIGHSGAVYTILLLMSKILTQNETGLQVKSLGLFSTPTYNLPPNMIVTPFRLFTLKLFDYPFLRPVILALIQAFVKFQGIQNRVDRDKIEDLLIAASTIGFSESEKSNEHLKLVRKFKVPTFLLIGCQDRLIPMRCFNQLKRDLGVMSEDQVKSYGEKGNLVRNPSTLNDFVEVSQFEAGGHYVFQRYWQQVNQDVCDFLTRKVIPTQNDSTKL